MIKKVFALLLLVTPAFASFHYVGRTLEPTAKVAYVGAKSLAKESSYPVRHPKKSVKGAAKGFTVAVKTAF